MGHVQAQYPTLDHSDVGPLQESREGDTKMHCLQKLTSKEKTALAALATEDSSSQASVLRRLIRRAARKRGLWLASQGRNQQQDAAFKEANNGS
jgi:hypothetical protein